MRGDRRAFLHHGDGRGADLLGRIAARHGAGGADRGVRGDHDTLAALHSVDYAAVGLGEYGKPGNYFERQVARWSKQYRMSQTDDLPEVEK
jgi:hypothetical protein